MKRLRLSWIVTIVIAAGVLLAAPAAGVIAFEEIAERSGLIFTTDSSPTPNKNQPETMVAGVALLDYDNDGYLDVVDVTRHGAVNAGRPLDRSRTRHGAGGCQPRGRGCHPRGDARRDEPPVLRRGQRGDDVPPPRGHAH